MEQSLYLVLGYIYCWLAVMATTAALAFFVHKGIKAHLKEARLGRGCVLLTDEEMETRR